ncbi:winged helix-turn-helix domain-containing protein [Burkholderia sp. L27(2015)]|uniref:winged helix-turn-helix domain-containing protein n=1 Tax=Burkholderia sp. L27(2015) TaxID=1641858 RepID=UPI00131B86DB|nr:winged helix-turn-helix domain-containing protein [Burkholderia sp. L27(2015)]
MISIGNLQVDFIRREIRHNRQLLQVGSRAFDILELLANANGALVSKDEIMRVVWPTTIVEENNLQVHVSALRKALGVDSELIRTVAGRGYRLLQSPNPINVTDLEARPSYVVQCSEPPPNSDVEAKIESPDLCHSAELVGRDQPLKELLVALRRCSVVTLVGTGGIGKTRLAIEAARHACTGFANGVAIVSLAAVTDEHFALEALAMALGLKITGCPLTMDAITKALAGKRRLIVLDNCEHVIDAAANIALELSNAAQVVLATSREPLRIPTETVYPVPSLEVPVDKARGNDVQMAAAVRLFLARVRAAEPGFQADEKCMDLIGALCRSLDGIPLAIELAAARAATLGVEALTCHLGNNLRILTGGYRTAMPRHQTMRATLDWSYRLLTDLERAIFRRLGPFIGGFTLDALRFLAKRESWPEEDMSEAFSGLILKSMVCAPSQGPQRRYRLLETTRQYALQRLDDNGEQNSAATVHAEYLMTLISNTHAQRNEHSDDSLMEVFSSELDNVRAALEWSLSPCGDASVGVTLASAAVPFFFELSLVGECCSRAQQALEVFKNAAICKVPPGVVLRLESAVAAALVFTSGPIDATRRAWSKVYSDAVLAGDVEHEARALWGLWNAHQCGGEPRDALIMAQRFRGLAGRTGNNTLCLLGMRIEGATLHYLGEQAEAREKLEAMLGAYDPSIHRWKMMGFRIEHGIVARATLARVLWAQGHGLQAMEMAQATFRAATAYDNELVTCHVLVESVIPIALMRNDLKLARVGIAALSTHAARMSFHTWIACCECYEMCAALISNPTVECVHALESKIAQLRNTGHLAPLAFLLWKKCEALAKLNELDAALAAADQALEHCEATGERWLHAELCRMKRTILMVLRDGMRAVNG